MWAITCILLIWIFILTFKVLDLESNIVLLKEKLENLIIKQNSVKKYFSVKKTIEQYTQDVDYEQQNIVDESNTSDFTDDFVENEYNQEPETDDYIKPNIRQTQYRTIEEGRKQTYKKENDFENIFLGNIFNIVGAIAIIIGCGIFIKLISPFLIFTPLMKTFIGFLLGIGMVLGGCYMKKESLKTYSEVLIGTGFSVLFITIYCTTILFKTFSTPVCAALGILTLISSYYLADKQKTASMIFVALIGGYLNVFLVFNEVSLNAKFIYLIFLNLLSIVFVYRNPSRSVINIINLLITMLIIISTEPFKIDFDSIKLGCPILLWFIHLVGDYLMRVKNPAKYDTLGVLNWFNLGVLIFLTRLISIDQGTLVVGALMIGTSVIYNLLICYSLVRNRDYFRPYLYTMIISILMAIYYLTVGNVRIASWCFVALLIAFISVKISREYLSRWIFPFLVASITNIFFMDGICYTKNIAEYTPIFNVRLISFGTIIITCVLVWLLFRNSKDKNCIDSANLSKFLCITLSYLYGIFELNDFLTSFLNEPTISLLSIKFILYSIIGFIYSLQIKKFGDAINCYILIVPSAIVAIVSLFVLFFAGNSYEPSIPFINIRLAAYSVAIGTSLLYARWYKLDFYKYLAIVLGWVLLTIETNSYIDNMNLANSYLVSVAWVLYSGILSTWGIFAENKVLKNSGIWISIIAVMRILMYDLSNVELIYKLIVFITLGTILMVVSYFYNKNKQ